MYRTENLALGLCLTFSLPTYALANNVLVITGYQDGIDEVTLATAFVKEVSESFDDVVTIAKDWREINNDDYQLVFDFDIDYLSEEQAESYRQFVSKPYHGLFLTSERPYVYANTPQMDNAISHAKFLREYVGANILDVTTDLPLDGDVPGGLHTQFYNPYFSTPNQITDITYGFSGSIEFQEGGQNGYYLTRVNSDFTGTGSAVLFDGSHARSPDALGGASAVIYVADVSLWRFEDDRGKYVNFPFMENSYHLLRSVDDDGDGVPNNIEEQQGTNPQDSGDFLDSDQGGVPDFVETDVFSPGTDPLDTSDDNLGSYYPVLPDTDGDGVPDSVEEKEGTDLSDDSDYLDTDNDGVPDAVERIQGTDSEDETSWLDSDGGGVADYIEDRLGQNADDFGDDFGVDSDGDGAPDSLEWLEGTDPKDGDDFNNIDTDGDRVPDVIERIEGTDPLDKSDFMNTDGGTLPDYLERVLGLDPNDIRDDKPAVKATTIPGNSASTGVSGGSISLAFVLFILLISVFRCAERGRNDV